MTKVCVFIAPNFRNVWITTRVAYTKLDCDDALKRAKDRDCKYAGKVDPYLSLVLEDRQAYCTNNEYQDVQSVIQLCESAGFSVLGFPKNK
ncbi:hypothetical protein phiAS5_ORF0169 [Aeromonas phage phiAS5]|uniref:Uncharacterized protein n=1 Tax=Aeromonas phage phiAS5 TaxID=879630 RepID=E1A2R6_9CAUD|nr:hypothetical protein phiAS5_ORF0169 [Aeromonas phage phiAS5]ADM80012.1 hypothetical protein phiAS5_ORF0169 [Aeromonas phage phiAS5]